VPKSSAAAHPVAQRWYVFLAYTEAQASVQREVIMFCPQCGKENEAGARFCGHCGATIGETVQASQSTPQPPGTPLATPVRIVTPSAAGEFVSPGLKWGVLALSVLMPAIGLIMGLYYWVKGESPDKVTVGKTWFFGALIIGIVYSLLSSAQY
jgi:hypothetical protein